MKFIQYPLLSVVCALSTQSETLVVEAEMYVTGSTVIDAPTHAIGSPIASSVPIICGFDDTVTFEGYTITTNNIEVESGRIHEGIISLNETPFLLIPELGDQKLLPEEGVNRYLKVTDIDVDNQTIELIVLEYDEADIEKEVALEVNGHTRVTGKLLIYNKYSDISMGIFGE